jgi:hypothetical protein
MTYTVSALWGLETASAGVQILVMISVLVLSVVLTGVLALVFGKPIPEVSDEPEDSDTANPESIPEES